MKISTLILVPTAAVAICCAAPCLAEAEEPWMVDFKAKIEKAITDSESPDTGGLAYTPSKEAALEDALKAAMTGETGNSRSCELMKTAVGAYNFDLSSVLKAIHSAGGSLEIDTLCSCATEAGVMPAVIAEAATESGKYDMQEIARSQCLSGLAYTVVDDPVTPPRQPRTPPETSQYTP